MFFKLKILVNSCMLIYLFVGLFMFSIIYRWKIRGYKALII